jgi:hypothetical protein
VRHGVGAAPLRHQQQRAHLRTGGGHEVISRVIRSARSRQVWCCGLRGSPGRGRVAGRDGASPRATPPRRPKAPRSARRPASSARGRRQGVATSRAARAARAPHPAAARWPARGSAVERAPQRPRGSAGWAQCGATARLVRGEALVLLQRRVAHAHRRTRAPGDTGKARWERAVLSWESCSEGPCAHILAATSMLDVRSQPAHTATTRSTRRWSLLAPCGGAWGRCGAVLGCGCWRELANASC